MKTKFLFIFVLCLITFNKSTNMISLANAEEVEDVDISIDDPRFSELRLEDQNLRLSSRIQDLEASNRIVNRSEIVRLNAKMDSNTETLVRERMTRDEESGGNYELNTGFTEDALGPAQHVLIIREAQINISCADPTNISSNLEIDVLAQQSGALYCSEERSTNNINDFCSCVSRSSANSDDGQYSPISSDNLQLMADLLVKKVIGDQAVNIRKLSDSIQRKYRWLNSNPQIYESQSDSLNNLSCISGGINSIIQEIATDESNRCNQSGLDFIADQFDIANKRFEENTPPGMSFRARAGEENESFGEYLDRIGSPQQAYENSGRLTPAYIDRDVLYRAARGTQFTRSAFNYGDDVNRLFSEYQSPLSEAQKAVKLEELISLLNEEENFRKLKRDPFLYSKFQQATQSCSLGCTPEQKKNGISSIVDFISVYATRNPGLNFSDAILGFETDQAAAFEVNECSELKNKFEKLCSDATTKDFKLTDYDIGRNPLGNPSLAQSLIEIGNASDSEEETIRNSTDQLMCSLTGNMTNTFDESGYTNFYSDPRIQHLLTKFESVDDFVAQATSIASDPERALQEAADYISSLEESSIFSEEFGLSDEDLAEIITDSNGSMQGTASSSASSDDADDTTSSSSASSSSSSTSSYLPTTTPTTPIPTSVPSATDEIIEESTGINEEEVARKNEEQMSRLKAEIEELRKNLALIEKSKEPGGPGDSIVSSSSKAEIDALRAELEDKEKRLKELEENQVANNKSSQGQSGQSQSTDRTSSKVSSSTPKSNTSSSGLTGSGSRSSSSRSSSVPSSSNTSSSGYSDFTESGIIQEQNNPYSAFYIRELPDGVTLSGELLSDSQVSSQIENNEVQVITLEKFREFRNSPQTIRLISNAEGGELFVLDQENNRLIKVEVNQENEFCLSSNEISECTAVANIDQGKVSDERSPASTETEQQGSRVRLKGLKGLLDKSINN